MSQPMTTDQVLAAAFGEAAVTSAGGVLPTATAQPATDSVVIDIQPPALQAQAPVVTAPASVPDAIPAATQLNQDNVLAQRMANIEALLAAQQQQQQQVAAPVAAAPSVPTYNPEQDALTPDELVTYQASLPVIEKITRQALHRAQQQWGAQLDAVRQQNEQLNERIASVQVQSSRADEVALMHTVRTQVPELETITRTPEWKQYLTQRAPFGGGASVQEVLQRATQSRDAATIAEHLNAFRVSRNITTPPAVVPAPGRTGTPVPVGVEMPQAAKGISASGLDQLTAKLQAGKVSREAYDAALEQLFSAMVDGASVVQ